MRCGSSADGKLPIGVQVVAAPWREDLCLAVAAYLETQVRRLAEAADLTHAIRASETAAVGLVETYLAAARN